MISNPKAINHRRNLLIITIFLCVGIWWNLSVEMYDLRWLSYQHYHDRQDENIIFLEARFESQDIAQKAFDSPARAKYLAAAADLWAGMSQFTWYTVSQERDILAEM